MRVDPLDPSSHYKPLWLVYGHACAPTLICCRINDCQGKSTIWGYSVYRRKPGFRTLGLDVEAWREERGFTLFEFYTEQPEAVERIVKLTTPSPKAL